MKMISSLSFIPVKSQPFSQADLQYKTVCRISLQRGPLRSLCMCRALKNDGSTNLKDSRCGGTDCSNNPNHTGVKYK